MEGIRLAARAGMRDGREWGGRIGAVFAEGRDNIRPGGHCESSALANALRAAGYDVEECDIVGGGGAPSFMFASGAFPFLGGRSVRMRETFFAAAGIPFDSRIPLERRDGNLWTPVLALLDSGIPVPLRVDMRFLPYRHGGKFGPRRMSFGWHWIALFGVDFDEGTAFVSDTEYTGLQRIRLRDLDRARRSPLKDWPPRGEYVALSRPGRAPFRPDAMALRASAIAATLANYEGEAPWNAAVPSNRGKAPLAGLSGLEAFPGILRNFDTQVRPWLAGPALSFLAGCIERNGTGGAAFRKLYRDFMAGIGEEALMPVLDESIEAWRALAAALDGAADSLSGRTRPEERKRRYAACAEAAERVAEAERRLREALAVLRGTTDPGAALQSLGKEGDRRLPGAAAVSARQQPGGRNAAVAQEVPNQ